MSKITTINPTLATKRPRERDLSDQCLVVKAKHENSAPSHWFQPRPGIGMFNNSDVFQQHLVVYVGTTTSHVYLHRYSVYSVFYLFL